MKIERHPPRRCVRFALAATALLGLANLASAAPRFVLKIADFDGSVLIPGAASFPDRGWIDVLGFGTSLPPAEDGDGTLTEAICGQNGFTFHKDADQATPRIQEALLRGLLLPAVQIRYLGETESPYGGSEPLIVELRHVQFSAYRTNAQGSGAAGDPLPTEEVTLNYSESQYIYRERDSKGRVVGETRGLLTYFLATDDPLFDDDLDGLTNDLDDDDDNDGIPDRLELAGGSNPFRDDAEEDLDSDRRSNREEAIAGTRMDDPGDFFGIESVTARRTPDGLQATVAIPVKAERHYRLLAATSLSLPINDWLELRQFELPEGSPDQTVTFEFDPAELRNAPRLFFRVEVSLLPHP